ncbi:unnamed protein product [Diabrotica balteata]|uniref:Uncharacterized protein n=1 Tax=Diabrotica balteata TaxID=107213 RepID=A0A9N9TB73_DIABA|nr:unnamed protein product [Diabrotica balteata]
MIIEGTEGKKEDFSMRSVSGKSYSFKRVDKFEYLGVVFDENGKEKWELVARIAKGNKKLGGLRALLNSKYVSRQAWTLNKKEEDTLERWERKILRCIFRGRKAEDGWERRTNNELMALYKEPTITKFVKAQRIRWLGHVERMAANRIPKLVITRKLIDPKRRGRPRTRWISKAEEDLKHVKRYYVNDELASGKGNLAFLQIGGEGEATAAWMTNGSWITYARKYKPILFQLEHRYYGKSHPTK